MRFRSSLGRVALALGAIVLAFAARAADPKPGGPMRVYVSGYSPTVTCFQLDAEKGTLTELSKSEGGKNPSFMALHPSGKFMYAINEGAPGKVVSFSVNPANGALTKINEASAAGNGPCYVSVHPSGKWAFSANYGSGHIGALPIKPDGSVGEPVEAILAGKNAHMIITDPTGKFVFVPCLGSNYVAQYIFDAESGKLTPNTPPNAPLAKPGAGPRHMAFHPTLKNVAYVIDELDSTMATLKYDPEKGVLSDPETLPTLPEGAPKNSTAHVVVAPSGEFLYGSNRGHNSIVIYSIDKATGKLALVGHETAGGDISTPRNFSVDPSGTLMLVGNQKTDSVTILKVDTATGKLTKLNTIPVTKGPSFVGIVPAPAP